ncbi:helix-turn-helix transcriptional regulator [Pseudonocardia saturnea]
MQYSTRSDDDRSTTAYAILGLLSLHSWTTYELAKQVQRSLSWFWPRTERRLYEEPKRLVAEGLATATKEYTGQRPRTVYSITDAGRAALRGWLDRDSASRTTETEAMLKVFFADAGSLEQLQTTLASIEREAAGRVAELDQVIAANRAGASRYPERLHLSVLALRLHVELELTVQRWTQWAREQTGEWNDSADPGGWDLDAVQTELARLTEVGSSPKGGQGFSAS